MLLIYQLLDHCFRGLAASWNPKLLCGSIYLVLVVGTGLGYSYHFWKCQSWCWCWCFKMLVFFFIDNPLNCLWFACSFGNGKFFFFSSITFYLFVVYLNIIIKKWTRKKRASLCSSNQLHSHRIIFLIERCK
jgi:hypothetical protein